MATALDADTVGPVDIAIVVFEGNQFTGEVAPALAALQANGTVHIIDLALVLKDAAGNVGIIEVGDSEVATALAMIGEDQLDLLSEEDLAAIASDLEPNSSALVLVWENTWASELAQAVRGANGTMTGLVRVPHNIVAEALNALEGEE